MKFTPALAFRADESFAEARRIEELLASPAVARDLKPH
jgi:ribosome-binding factor A